MQISYFYLGYWDKNDILQDLGRYGSKDEQLKAYYQYKIDGYRAKDLVKKTYYQFIFYFKWTINISR